MAQARRSDQVFQPLVGSVGTGGGAAVAAHNYHAGLAKPAFRRRDMDDSALASCRVKICNPEFGRVAAHGADLRRGHRVGVVTGIAAGRDHMVGLPKCTATVLMRPPP